MKILIVEDEIDLQGVLADFLSKEKYSFDAVATYREASEKVALYDYDCILLDINLPDTKSQHVASTFKPNGKDTTITFEGEQNGKIPATWSAETSRWETSNDNTNIVLKMLSNDGSAFNIAMVKDLYYQNFDIETRVKSVSGSEDQGGGLVWRYLDKNNYYIIRANPLENNIRLYKVAI